MEADEVARALFRLGTPRPIRKPPPGGTAAHAAAPLCSVR